ncbi:MAG: hypothetical protein HWE27_15025 [Gammaproteobacteria bacterium]|nr:hypothetical protein [Gammaproteobacteria bacterium]
MYKILTLFMVVALLVGCKHTEQPNLASPPSAKVSVKVFPLANKMMYQKTDPNYVAEVNQTFDNKALVYVKIRPRYTHKVLINNGRNETEWFFNEAGFVERADKTNSTIFKIEKPELISDLFFKK